MAPLLLISNSRTSYLSMLSHSYALCSRLDVGRSHSFRHNTSLRTERQTTDTRLSFHSTGLHIHPPPTCHFRSDIHFRPRCSIKPHHYSPPHFPQPHGHYHRPQWTQNQDHSRHLRCTYGRPKGHAPPIDRTHCRSPRLAGRNRKSHRGDWEVSLGGLGARPWHGLIPPRRSW